MSGAKGERGARSGASGVRAGVRGARMQGV